jgi:hypothetical protein
MILWRVVLEYAIRRVQVNQKGKKLNGTHQVVVYADDVNILGGCVQTVRKNTKALVVARKAVDLKLNAEKTTYMVMSGDQNAGRTHSIKTDNSSFEWLEQFKYFRTTLTNENAFMKKLRAD